ncbi:hypothetical protein LXL04_008978 [Taraxacum kok-saghyz]
MVYASRHLKPHEIRDCYYGKLEIDVLMETFRIFSEWAAGEEEETQKNIPHDEVSLNISMPSLIEFKFKKSITPFPLFHDYQDPINSMLISSTCIYKILNPPYSSSPNSSSSKCNLTHQPTCNTSYRSIPRWSAFVGATPNLGGPHGSSSSPPSPSTSPSPSFSTSSSSSSSTAPAPSPSAPSLLSTA